MITSDANFIEREKGLNIFDPQRILSCLIYFPFTKKNASYLNVFVEVEKILIFLLNQRENFIKLTIRLMF